VERRSVFSNFGSLKSTEILCSLQSPNHISNFQQFRLVEEH